MQTPKSEILEMIQSMPDDMNYEDLLEALFLRQRIQKSLNQVEAGDVLSHEEVKARVSKWLLAI